MKNLKSLTEFLHIGVGTMGTGGAIALPNIFNSSQIECLPDLIFIKFLFCK